MKSLWLFLREAGKALGLLLCAVGLLLWFSNRLNQSRSDVPELRPGEWQESEDATRLELERVVEAQLVALREGQFLAAYGLASMQVQKQLSAVSFESMIWAGYPELAMVSLHEFREAVDNGTQASVEVRFAFPFGNRAWFAYFLVREHGTWRVLGVARQVGPRGRNRGGR